MLPKNRRIPRKQFPLFFSSGARIYRNGLFLLKVASGAKGESKFCFSVSKKIAKKAVDRNKARRSGYRSIGKILNQIKPEFMAIFSFLRLPKNDHEVDLKLREILEESLLIK